MKILRIIFNFYVITAILAVIAGFGIHTALGRYELYLADYEKTQPTYVIDNIMDTYFSPPDYAEWAAQAPLKDISEFESIENYQILINNHLSDKKVAFRDESSNKTFVGDKKNYTVLSGGIPFAEFSVVKNPKPSEYGFDIWELESINALPLDYTPQNSVSFSIVKGSTLFVNEKAVDEKYFVREDKKTDSVNHMPEGVTGIVYDLYEINGLIHEPNFYAIDKNGWPVLFEFDKKRNVYNAELNYDIISDDIQFFCIESLLAYCKYITNDGSLNEVGKYFSRGTRVWKAISSTEVIWYTSHTGYDYKDISVSDFYCYDENTFSARVKATQYIFRGSRTDIFDIDFIFYFVRQDDGKFMIYDMVNHI